MQAGLRDLFCFECLYDIYRCGFCFFVLCKLCMSSGKLVWAWFLCVLVLSQRFGIADLCWGASVWNGSVKHAPKRCPSRVVVWAIPFSERFTAVAYFFFMFFVCDNCALNGGNISVKSRAQSPVLLRILFFSHEKGLFG